MKCVVVLAGLAACSKQDRPPQPAPTTPAVDAAVADPIDVAGMDALYAKPGQLVTTSDGARLNFYCVGTGAPAVILEAAYADWSPVWLQVQSRVAKWTRVCSYDRAGYGFSPSGPKPRTVQQVTAELHDALHALHVTGPYVLVSHATGTNTIRAFADNYLDEVAGLVMIDPDIRDMVTDPDVLKNWLAIDARNLTELHMCRDAVAAHEKPPLVPPPDHPSWTCDDLLLRALPDPMFSAKLNAALLEIATNLALYDALIDEKESRIADGAYLRDHAISLGARPVRVIATGSQFRIGPTTPPDRRAAAETLNRTSLIYQQQLLAASSNAKRILADKNGSYVQLEAPGIVVGAIREVYDQSGR